VQKIIRFDCYEVDLGGGQLYRRGVRLRLPDQSFRVLAALLEHPGRAVTRDELRQRLWAGDVFVDFDNVLNSAVARLREALHDRAGRSRFIETLPRRGYRFIGPVERSLPADVARPMASRLLVLPFLNASGDAAQDYFSDAMTDDIITALADRGGGNLAVIARTTAMHYKGTNKDIAKIGRELSLDWVVEGSARRSSGDVTLTVQLVRVRNQAHVFAKRYDGLFDDIFALERSIAEDLAAEVGEAPAQEPPGGSQRAGASRIPTADPVAYNCYMQGRYHFNSGQSPANWAKAREYLEAAIARDPQFAVAYDALAELWWYLGFFGVLPARDTLAAGVFHAIRAVEIDNTLADAHAMLGQYRKQLDFNWAEVHREMSLALELSPGSPRVRMRRAITGLMPLGRLDEAVAELELALEVDPLALFPGIWLAAMFWLKRDYARGIERARWLADLEPRTFTVHWIMGLVCREAGLYPEAIAAFGRATDLAGPAPMILGWLGLALAESGDREGARAMYERLRAMSTKVHVPPTCFAFIHIGLGEVDAFFEWMHRSIEARDHMIMPIKSYPFFDPIRDDPRYEDLLRKMNLEG